MAKPPMRRRAWLSAGASAVVLLSSAPAWSEDDVAAQLKQLRALVEAQAKQIDAQRQVLDAQGQQLRDQAQQLQKLQAPPVATLDDIRGLGLEGQTDNSAAAAQAQSQTAQSQTAQAPSAQSQAGPAPAGADQAPPPPPPPPQPVGEAPPPSSSKAAAAAVTPALPESIGVLTPRGHWVVEPQFEYLHASSNELVFRGVQIVPGIQLGVIDANTALNDTFSAALDARYGLSSRAEIEVRVPYVWRHEVTQTLAQQSAAQNITETIATRDIGDVELTGRYQLNAVRTGSQAPIWIAALDVKSDTGLGPFDVHYDKFGVAQELATGSGFWAIEPSISVLYPSDPVVLFANVGYVESIPRNFNRTISPNVVVGIVRPGGAPTASIGFAFALNDRFSFSLGFKESYFRPTATEVNHVWSSSLPLNVGVSTFGMSYRITPTINLSNNFEFGMTRDAPDLHMLTRLSLYY